MLGIGVDPQYVETCAGYLQCFVKETRDEFIGAGAGQAKTDIRLNINPVHSEFKQRVLHQRIFETGLVMSMVLRSSSGIGNKLFGECDEIYVTLKHNYR